MNSKTLFLVLVFLLAIPNIFSAQNTGKTAQELKTAENAVKTGKTLINIFKKKKKSEQKETEIKDDETNNVINKEDEENANVDSSNQPKADTPLTKDASILFKNCVSKTSNAEKNEITTAMNIVSTPDGSQFYINDQYSKDFTFTVSVYPLDLNHDGVEEVALVYGHPAISGDNAISTLFIKDEQGHYNTNFGFSGSLIVLTNSAKDFPDIALGGPGFAFPVWHWDGKNYSNYTTINNDKLEKMDVLYLEEASKIYVDSISK